MDEYTERRFGHLRILSTDEKLQMIRDLEEDIETLNQIIDDKNTSSEQRSELYSDIAHDESQIRYLRAVLEEKQL
jgi:hypothetical protein